MGGAQRRSRVPEGDRPPTTPAQTREVSRYLLLLTNERGAHVNSSGSSLCAQLSKHPTAFANHFREVRPSEPARAQKQLAEPDIEKSRSRTEIWVSEVEPLEARSHLARHTAPAAIAARRCLVAAHPGGGAAVTALPLVHARLFSRARGASSRVGLRVAPSPGHQAGVDAFAGPCFRSFPFVRSLLRCV